MTEGEVFAMLAGAFGLDDVLARYRPMKAHKGLAEAIDYWHWSKDMQEGVGGGAAWWEYENHKTLAYVLMGIYCWRVLGHDEFPSLPDAGPDVLSDQHALLCLWSRSLILDHVHRWQTCRHAPGRNRLAHPQCKATGRPDSEGLSHIVCCLCGEERFDPQPMVDRAKGMLSENWPQRAG